MTVILRLNHVDQFNQPNQTNKTKLSKNFSLFYNS